MNEVIRRRFSSERFLLVCRGAFITAGVCLLSAIVLGLIPTNARESVWWKYGIVAACLCGSVYSLAWIWWQYWVRTEALTVGPVELSWQERGRSDSARWDQVKKVTRYDVYTLTLFEKPSEVNRWAYFRLYFEDGRTFTVRQTLGDYDLVVALIEAHTAKAMIPGYLRQLAPGGDAKFGPVAINAYGVKIERKLYDWPDVAWTVVAGHLKLLPTGDSERDHLSVLVEVSSITNYPALFRLMARVGKPPLDPVESFPKAWRKQAKKCFFIEDES